MIRQVRIALLAVGALSSCYVPPLQGEGGGGGNHTGSPGGGVGGATGVSGGGFGGGGFAGGGGAAGGAGGGAACFGGGFDAGVESTPVVSSVRQAPPVSGGTMTVMANGTIVAADPDRDRVWILASASALTHEVVLSTGDEPGRVVEGPLDRAFVALRGAGAVAEVNLLTGAVVARHPACAAPRGLGWSASKSMLTVACATGSLARLGFTVGVSALTPTGRVLQHPADDLRDVVVRSNDVLVSTFRNPKVLQVADDGSVQELSIGGSFGMARRVAYRMVATSTGVMMAHQVQLSVPLPSTPCGTSYSGLGGSPDAGKSLGIVSTGLSAFGTTTTTLGLNEAVLPVDLATTPSGDWALVAAGSRLTFWFHQGTGLTERIVTGGEPTAVAFRNGELLIFEREPAAIWVKPNSTVMSRFPLPAGSMASTGHELFHRATSAGLACASCHPEATDDGHIWALPEGLRRTNMLRGGLKASAPFHWQGDRSDMQALLSDVMVQRMGGRPQTVSRGAALMDWLDAVPALPVPDGLDPMAVARGKALFEAPTQQCLACHPGPLGTNNANMTVGTGGSFQTPRLVGLAMRAPYFHDGRVATLAARFNPEGGGEVHGRTAALTAAERADLVEYLRSR